MASAERVTGSFARCGLAALRQSRFEAFAVFGFVFVEIAAEILVMLFFSAAESYPMLLAGGIDGLGAGGGKPYACPCALFLIARLHEEDCLATAKGVFVHVDL